MLTRLGSLQTSVDTSIASVIRTHHPLLLSHLSSSSHLSSQLSAIRLSLSSLDLALGRLNSKIHTPYVEIDKVVRRADKVRMCSEVLRRASRFVTLARRLEMQMSQKDEREAALTLHELDGLVHAASAIPLSSLQCIHDLLPRVQAHRETVIRSMESSVVSALASLDQGLLSASLQTAHNLGLLPQLVANLLADLNDAVEARVTKVFDVSVAPQSSSSSSSTGIFARKKDAAPTAASTAATLWSRLESLMEDVAQCCVKVYTLERVLKLKIDPNTQVDFLTACALDETPSFTFWTTLASSLDASTRSSTSVVQQVLTQGYPRLLRLFQSFFAKIGVHTGTQYGTSPEAILILRSVARYENTYLARASTRMADAQRTGVWDANQVQRAMASEVDSARFDPLLLRGVTRTVAKALDDATARVEGALIKDFSATSLVGPLANSSQQTNAQLVSFLWHVSDLPLEGELVQAIERARATCARVIDSLDTAIRRDVSSTLVRMHKVDFSKPFDPLAGANANAYVTDLADKLAFVRGELLARFSLGERIAEWQRSIAAHTLRSFVFHASITRPLGESGKLRLTTDMTEIEFALGTFAGRLDRLDEYRAMRAFRQALFLDAQALAHPEDTQGLSPLIVLHHLIVLSPLQLPHQLHAWSPAEYALWVDKHTPAESYNLLERAVDGQREGKGAEEWRALIKQVLRSARDI